ncbi:MAG: molybdate ABC transporter permease subunit [Sorangiineae bacterium]|nr:molybdate ABC transporter permease subunit [Polyangiaceae bacterium]MEB2321467.1 molybdate ABC transporter permease subunit [Sorangiineae bacterium]
MSDLGSTLLVTLEVAATAIALSFVPAMLVAYGLARRSFFGKSVVETLMSLPLVLPPTAIGYLLLELFAVDGILGARSLGVELDVLFTWKGAVVASAVMAWPLMVRTARVAFEAVDPRLEAMGRTLGYGPATAFARVTLPVARRGLLAALVLGFSRALGEFGATIIVAGNVPGKTRTLSLAIFSAEQRGDDASARALLWVAVALGFVAVLVVERLSRPVSGRRLRA